MSLTSHFNKKKIVLLGGTGSIGSNVLKIVAQFPERFEVLAIAVERNAEKAIEQARTFGIKTVAITNISVAEKYKNKEEPHLKILGGSSAIEDIAALPEADIVVVAMVGTAAIKPLIKALQAGKRIALATKETLVAAGAIVMEMGKKFGAKILPVDSEHSAIFQCLEGRDLTEIENLILTASGGPFADDASINFDKVDVDAALRHPRWTMGRKVTIDSATMMNKGLELIEAHWLFNMPVERIKIIIHPESIIHSMVELVDGSLLAQMSQSDMRFAIQYALSWPERLNGALPHLNLSGLGKLSFMAPDQNRFPALKLARVAAETGGTLPAVLNAANEVAVEEFLKKSIPFSAIWQIIERVMALHKPEKNPALETILAFDQWARQEAKQIARSFSK
jgi:1-deoxy-D-xylulose-5-phosphate reductoisomerase